MTDMSFHRLKLNPGKGYVDRNAEHSVQVSKLQSWFGVESCIILASREAHSLGVNIDAQLGMKQQVHAISRACFYQLH